MTFSRYNMIHCYVSTGSYTDCPTIVYKLSCMSINNQLLLRK